MGISGGIDLEMLVDGGEGIMNFSFSCDTMRADENNFTLGIVVSKSRASQEDEIDY